MAYRTHVVPSKTRRGVSSAKTEPPDTPYGLEIIESCLSGSSAKERIFCELSPGALESLDAISSWATYPKGAILFVEGQSARGVFIVGHGRVRLSTSSRDGKSLILRIADAGEVIGLPGTISGKPYEVTAEALEPIQASFIARKPFLRFLRESSEASLRVAEILSEIYRATYREVRHLGFSRSSSEKLARFLLDLAPANRKASAGVEWPLQIPIAFTHQQVAQTIGSSRETVTRLFADFKRRRLVEIQGSTLIISNRVDLEKLANSEP